MKFHYIVHESLSYSLTAIISFQWHKMCILSQTVYYYHYDSITKRHWQPSNEIHIYILTYLIRNW